MHVGVIRQSVMALTIGQIQTDEIRIEKLSNFMDLFTCGPSVLFISKFGSHETDRRLIR